MLGRGDNEKVVMIAPPAPPGGSDVEITPQVIVETKWTSLWHRVELGTNTFLIFCLFLCLVRHFIFCGRIFFFR